MGQTSSSLIPSLLVSQGATRVATQDHWLSPYMAIKCDKMLRPVLDHSGRWEGHKLPRSVFHRHLAAFYPDRVFLDPPLLTNSRNTKAWGSVDKPCWRSGFPRLRVHRGLPICILCGCPESSLRGASSAVLPLNTPGCAPVNPPHKDAFLGTKESADGEEKGCPPKPREAVHNSTHPRRTGRGPSCPRR